MISLESKSIKTEANINDSLFDSDTPLSNEILTAAKGGGVSFAGRIFEYAVRFVFGILIARVIGLEQYGLYNLAITTALVVSNMAWLGLQVGMVRYLPPAIREKDSRSVWAIIQVGIGLPALISIFIAIGMFFLAEPLAALLFKDPRMVPLLRIVSILVPLDTLAALTYVITISFKQPKYSVLANYILAPLVKLMLAAAFLAVGLSTHGVLWAQIIASVTGLIVMIYFINTLFPLRRALGSTGGYLVQLLRYSLPVHLGWMVTTLRSNFSTFVLGFLGLTTGVGVFAAASRFSMIGSMFYLSVGNISTPIIADLHSQNDTAKLKAYYATTTRWMVMFNLPIFLTSVLFAKPMLWIFGDDFTTGAASMIIMAFGTLVYTATGVGANILDMTDHPRVNTINSVVMALITIILNVLFVPRWGVSGAAAASSISAILVNVACLIEVRVLLGMQPYNRSFIKPLFAGLAAALVAYMLNHFFNLPYLLQLILGGGMLWIVYAFTLYKLKLPHDDWLVIERLLTKICFRRPVVQNVA